MPSPLGATGSVIGFTLIALAIVKTWWVSPFAFASGVVYLLILNAAYLLARSARRRQTQ